MSLEHIVVEPFDPLGGGATGDDDDDDDDDYDEVETDQIGEADVALLGDLYKPNGVYVCMRVYVCVSLSLSLSFPCSKPNRHTVPLVTRRHNQGHRAHSSTHPRHHRLPRHQGCNPMAALAITVLGFG